MVSDETIRLRNANFQVQFLQLCFVYGGRSVDHHITSGIVFRKCYKIPNSFLSAQNCYQTVQTKSESTMRRCAVLKRVQKKAKLLLCLVCCKSEVFKHRSEEHTSELQSRENLVCRLLLKIKNKDMTSTHL